MEKTRGRRATAYPTDGQLESFQRACEERHLEPSGFVAYGRSACDAGIDDVEEGACVSFYFGVPNLVIFWFSLRVTVFHPGLLNAGLDAHYSPNAKSVMSGPAVPERTDRFHSLPFSAHHVMPLKGR